MPRKIAVLVPLFAGVIGLLAVEQADARHPVKKHVHVIKPKIPQDGWRWIGATASTLRDDNGNPNGLLIQSTVQNGLADVSGLETGDVIVAVNGQNPGTSFDFDALLKNEIAAGTPSLPLLVVDHNDPNAGPQPLDLFLQ